MATALGLVLLLGLAMYLAGRLQAKVGYRFGYRFGYRQGYFDGDRAGWSRRRREAQDSIGSSLRETGPAGSGRSRGPSRAGGTTYQSVYSAAPRDVPPPDAAAAGTEIADGAEPGAIPVGTAAPGAVNPEAAGRDPGLMPDPALGPDPVLRPDPDLRTDPDRGPNPALGPDSDLRPDQDVRPDPGLRPDQDVRPDPGLGSDPRPGSNPDLVRSLVRHPVRDPVPERGVPDRDAPHLDVPGFDRPARTGLPGPQQRAATLFDPPVPASRIAPPPEAIWPPASIPRPGYRAAGGPDPRRPSEDLEPDRPAGDEEGRHPADPGAAAPGRDSTPPQGKAADTGQGRHAHVD